MCVLNTAQVRTDLGSEGSSTLNGFEQVWVREPVSWEQTDTTENTTFRAPSDAAVIRCPKMHIKV